MDTHRIGELVKEHSTPLMITDCEIIRNNYHTLQKALPTVKLFYAIKPFPHSTVLQTLYDIGAGFDVATNGEIELLKKSKVPSSSCIHTHPIKRDKDIKEAIKFGITHFVVDNIEEIGKFIKYAKRVKLVIRVAFSNPTATIDLSKKFGCDPTEVIQLMVFARDNRIHVNGLCFHVGSQSMTSGMYVTAINKCNDIIAETILRGLPAIEILDIGGGFPVTYDTATVDIMDFCAPINAALMRIPPNVKIYAEPGRYIVGTASISVATVIGRKIKDDKFHYYIDDGIYDSYSLQFFDSIIPTIEPIRHSDTGNLLFNSIIWGITCDSTDKIREVLWPKLEIGDYIIAKNMGAYTSLATGTHFNMVDRAKHVFVNVLPSPP